MSFNLLGLTTLWALSLSLQTTTTMAAISAFSVQRARMEKMEQLLSMGFSAEIAAAALAATGGSSVADAADWILSQTSSASSPPLTSPSPSNSQAKLNRFFPIHSKSPQPRNSNPISPPFSEHPQNPKHLSSPFSEHPQNPKHLPPPFSHDPQIKRRKLTPSSPLAERMRPRVIAEIVGQDHILGPTSLLTAAVNSARLPSIVLWGPPGSGKTSVARAVANSASLSYNFAAISAVNSGVKDVRDVAEEARKLRAKSGRKTLLFVDEVHRFNKTQQDSFLPLIEDGSIVFIGATTENPSFHLVTPLLSRCRVLILNPLKPCDVACLLRRAVDDESERGLSGSVGMRIRVQDGVIELLSSRCDGDARVALNALEVSATRAASWDRCLKIPSGVGGKSVEIERNHGKDKPGSNNGGFVAGDVNSAEIEPNDDGKGKPRSNDGGFVVGNVKSAEIFQNDDGKGKTGSKDEGFEVGNVNPAEISQNDGKYKPRSKDGVSEVIDVNSAEIPENVEKPGSKDVVSEVVDANSTKIPQSNDNPTSKDEVFVVINLEDAKEALQCKHLAYDRAGEEHYNLISALHKSMRGSDADASLYWLARMLEGGEQPLYIARRLVRFASEDVGLADPNALVQAVACHQACHFIGMPECNVILAQCVAYLALAPKSVAVYEAMKDAQRVVRESVGGNEGVPLHLRNAPTKLMKDVGYGKGYIYTPDNPSAPQTFLPPSLLGRKFLDWPPNHAETINSWCM